MGVRIKDQTTDNALQSGDFVIVDSQSEGTRKFDLGAELTDIRQDLQNIIEGGGGGGLTEDIKLALLQLAQKVAYIDEDGQDYYDDLYDALYSVVVTFIKLNTYSLSFITLNSTQQLTATTTPVGGAVTWSSSNTSIATVSSTGLVTAKGYGNATITATSGSVSASCSVAVSQATLSSISAVYTQSGTVYDSDSLNVLKSDLVVTGHYSNGTTGVITEYTLTGTLVEGTSTITVNYGGKTTTFNVTVTHKAVIDYTLDALAGVTWTDNYKYNSVTGELQSANGEHCTSKFSVQDALYIITDANNVGTYYAYYIWDEDDNFMGAVENTNFKSTIPVFLKPEYTYAIKCYSTNFNSSSISMLPVDRRQVDAYNSFSINLSEHINEMTQNSNRAELNITDILNSLGIDKSTFPDRTISSSHIFILGDVWPSFKTLAIGTIVYSGNRLLRIVNTSCASYSDLISYIQNNNIVLEFNY